MKNRTLLRTGIVGAVVAWRGGLTDAGRVYVFNYFVPSQMFLFWTELQDFAPATRDRFGGAVAISNGVIAVIAVAQDGAVYVFDDPIDQPNEPTKPISSWSNAMKMTSRFSGGLSKRASSSSTATPAALSLAPGKRNPPHLPR